MTPKQWAKNLNGQFKRAALTGLNKAAREGVAIAKQDSSGRWNRARRRKRGYSYSRFNPNPPPQPLGVINIETGIFKAAWHKRNAVLQSGTAFAFVVNDSDRVPDLIDAAGKPWLSRPIDRRVRDRLAPVARFEIENALSRVGR